MHPENNFGPKNQFTIRTASVIDSPLEASSNMNAKSQHLAGGRFSCKYCGTPGGVGSGCSGKKALLLHIKRLKLETPKQSLKFYGSRNKFVGILNSQTHTQSILRSVFLGKVH